MVKFFSPTDKSCSCVLNFLQSVNEKLWIASEWAVAVVLAGQNESEGLSLSGYRSSFNEGRRLPVSQTWFCTCHLPSELSPEYTSLSYSLCPPPPHTHTHTRTHTHTHTHTGMHRSLQSLTFLLLININILAYLFFVHWRKMTCTISSAVQDMPRKLRDSWGWWWWIFSSHARILGEVRRIIRRDQTARMKCTL